MGELLTDTDRAVAIYVHDVCAKDIEAEGTAVGPYLKQKAIEAVTIRAVETTIEAYRRLGMETNSDVFVRTFREVRSERMEE